MLFLYLKTMFNIVLIAPEIPNNTGTIGRICVNTGATLHLIRPLGFEINETRLKRAGLDYWKKLAPKIYENMEEFMQEHINVDRFFFSSAKSTKPYFESNFKPGDYLFFGSESCGISEEIMKLNEENNITIPVTSEGRSLNIGVSVGIITYEAIRQNFLKF